MWSYRDAVGAIWFVYSGKNPDGVFKQQVARFMDKKWKWYDVPVLFHGRPTASIEPSGLYITYIVNENGNEVRRWKVPDFVMPGYPTDGQSAPVPPTPPVEMVDQTARQNIQQLRQLVDALTKANAQQAELIKALRNDLNAQRPSAGLTWLQIKDHLWNDSIIQDKVYLDLQQKGGIYGMIEALVKSLLGK